MEFWDGEALESITEPLGWLLKVDEFMSSLSRTRFARICLEIDLALLLKRGLWLEDEDGMAFILILYEHLPTFCYHCWMV